MRKLFTSAIVGGAVLAGHGSAMAAIDVVYRTAGGDWWARTYTQSGITPGGVQAAPEAALFGSNSDHLNFGQMNNDAGGYIDNIYGDIGGGLYWTRTWTPGAPQPGPAGAVPNSDSNSVPGFGFNGGSGFRQTAMGDYNNNGQSDFFYQEGPAGAWYGKQYQSAAPQPGPNATVVGSEQSMPFPAGKFHIGDWNNDGLLDTMTVDGSDRWRANTYTQSGPEVGVQGHANGAAPIVLGGASGRPILIADVNNDGFEDFLYRDAGTWYRQTYLPDLTTVADLADGIMVGSETSLVNAPDILVGDYNNDGLNDLLTVVGSTWRAFTILPDNNLGSPFDLELGSANEIRFLVNYNNSEAIPEPGTLSLIGGLAALGLSRRRR